MIGKHTLCNCPAGFSAAPERHAPDCPGRVGAGKPALSSRPAPCSTCGYENGMHSCAIVLNGKLAAKTKDLERAHMRIREMDLLFGRYILAMRSALIEQEHGKGSEAAMVWIFNSLAGPGELPPEDETDAQAYFDREIAPVDESLQEIMSFWEADRQANAAKGVKS